MVDFNKQICRLCLAISPTCECETIDGSKKEILQVLQINMDFDVSNCAVACNRCLERLHDCFDFKSRIITTRMEDIKKTSQREMMRESLCMEKLQGCQLCMSPIKEDAYNYTTDLKSAVLLEDMIRNCFPEVDLNTHVQESHTCKQCVSSLERHYEFLKNCQEVEQKIVHFCQVANHCTANKVNLDDILKFKDYDILGTPLIIKKERSDAENVDENATKCSKSEDIASIKCEEIHIKDELDDRVKIEDDGESRVHDSSGDSRSSEEATETGTSATKDCTSNAKKHMFTHSDNDVLECALCSFITNTRLSLQAHMASHSGLTKKYGCPECKYRTGYKSDLDRHFLKHKDNSEVQMYECPSCTYKTKYKYYLMNHLKMLHKDPQEIPKYKCEVCNHKSKYKRNIARHMQTHQDPKVVYKFQCEKCPFKTKWKDNLEKHVFEIHENPRVDYKFQCEKCQFKTKWKQSLERHVTGTHQDPKVANKFQCEICPFTTKWKRTLERHLLTGTHQDPKVAYKFQCEKCPFETKWKGSLKRHVTGTHDNPKVCNGSLAI